MLLLNWFVVVFVCLLFWKISAWKITAIILGIVKCDMAYIRNLSSSAVLCFSVKLT